MNELIVLAADPTMGKVIGTLLRRHEALGIGSVGSRSRIVVHPERDGGIASTAAEVLRPFRKTYHRSLVVCDRHGCGHSGSRVDIEIDLERRLALSGWETDCAAVVIEPELEVWLWQQSPHVEAALGWSGRNPNLWDWAEGEFAINSRTGKPEDPKACIVQALKLVRKIRSAALYDQVASKASLRRCVDPSFVKFRDTLKRWFPVDWASIR